MLRGLSVLSVVVAAVMVAQLSSAWAQSCGDRRSTDPNCYRNGEQSRPEDLREVGYNDSNCDGQGRSRDPNCYRAGGYVCGPCPADRRDWRGGRDGGRNYSNCDGQGRSRDPNCYRAEGYVCGPCPPRRRGSNCDGRGRSADPNCYRGKRRVYVCGPCWD
jgi:hypothetical protein